MGSGQRFAEQGQRLCVDGNLAHLGDENIAGNAYDVADVEQFFKNGVVKRFILSRADVIPFYIQLYAAAFILQFNERGSPHDPPAHDPAGDADLLV